MMQCRSVDASQFISSLISQKITPQFQYFSFCFFSFFILSQMKRARFLDSLKLMIVRLINANQNLSAPSLSSICGGMVLQKFYRARPQISSVALLTYQYPPGWMFSSNYLMISLNRWDYSLAEMTLAPIYPINPPTIPPIKAPKKGIGITLCPTTAPRNPEPKELSMSTVMKPACFILLFLLTILLLKMAQRVQLYPPVANMIPMRGMLVATQLKVPFTIDRLERSNMKSPAESQLLMEARHFPSAPPNVLKWSVTVTSFIFKGLPLNFSASLFLSLTTLRISQFFSAASVIFHFILSVLQFSTFSLPLWSILIMQLSDGAP